MWLIYVFIQHTNNKTGFRQTTSFVYQFSVVWSVSQFIERDCFIRQRVVQNVMWVAQYFLNSSSSAQSCCLSPIRRNSVLEELKVRRLAVIQEVICCRAFCKWLMLKWKCDGWKERKRCLMLIKLEWLDYRTVKKTMTIVSRYHLIPERYGRTDGQTDGQTDLLYQYRASVCWHR